MRQKDHVQKTLENFEKEEGLPATNRTWSKPEDALLSPQKEQYY
jgi:hypothetical protein